VEIISNWSAVATPVCLAATRNATRSPVAPCRRSNRFEVRGKDPTCYRADWP